MPRRETAALFGMLAKALAKQAADLDHEANHAGDHQP